MEGFPLYFYELSFVYGPRMSPLSPEVVLCLPTQDRFFPFPFPLFPFFSPLSPRHCIRFPTLCPSAENASPLGCDLGLGGPESVLFLFPF